MPGTTYMIQMPREARAFRSPCWRCGLDSSIEVLVIHLVFDKNSSYALPQPYPISYAKPCLVREWEVATLLCVNIQEDAALVGYHCGPYMRRNTSSQEGLPEPPSWSVRSNFPISRVTSPNGWISSGCGYLQIADHGQTILVDDLLGLQQFARYVH
ncbi:hypothetical protein BDQ12DRAFT_315110 [Crucibulum laeve]|uniref:Uncharacterized protein n=1 Tax=Crucibulum laeve TaxID=68775 RepID=A0A5C3LS27_9AGAR|nr:hypothetical protein BDQ12DRAFT_315110 [Crucibulum laeve]